jgi:hypothetical protein
MSSRLDRQPEASQTPGYFWLFTAIVLLYCLWVLSLPLFPTQDGPVHLYLATIFKGLLSHSAGIYDKYYFIRHYLPPYSFYYYLLVALMHVMSALNVEKLFVCLILISFAYGFRFLAAEIGPNGPVFSLFVLCILLNWALGMGFENFVFSLSMAFWALGLWMRMNRNPAILPRASFVLIIFVMMLTHPVPVAIVLGFAGLDLVLSLALPRLSRAGKFAGRVYFARDTVTLFAASCTLLYISFFTEKRRTLDNIRNTIHPFAEFRSFYGHLEGIRYFNGHDWRVYLYSFAIYALLGIAAGVLLFGRRRIAAGVLTWRVAFILFLLAVPCVPMDINGLHMFATRLVLLVWLAAFAAASGTERLNPTIERCLVGFAAATSFGILALAHLDVSREAKQIDEIVTAPVTQQNRLGLLLPGLEQHITPSYDFNVDPFVWAGLHYFREGHDVVLNTPWTDNVILPANARPELGLQDFDPLTLEFYYELRKHIEEGDPVALKLLARADFILFATGGQQVNEQAVQHILEAEPASAWSCAPTTSWTTVCERKPATLVGTHKND